MIAFIETSITPWPEELANKKKQICAYSKGKSISQIAYRIHYPNNCWENVFEIITHKNCVKFIHRFNGEPVRAMEMVRASIISWTSQPKNYDHENTLQNSDARLSPSL